MVWGIGTGYTVGVETVLRLEFQGILMLPTNHGNESSKLSWKVV